MKNKIFLTLLILINFSCEKSSRSTLENNKSITTDSIDTIKPKSTIESTLSNKTVKFLWRENIFDKKLKDTINKIFINDEFCKTISDPEKAALAYVATFVGNECEWDGKCNENRSNLKCKILTALDLGYQCSDKHLSFIRKMFKNDVKVLLEFKEPCPTIPDGATNQNTFDEITLKIREKKIFIHFMVSGINTYEGHVWSYKQTNIFQIENDNSIKLININKTITKNEHYNPNY